MTALVTTKSTKKGYRVRSKHAFVSFVVFVVKNQRVHDSWWIKA